MKYFTEAIILKKRDAGEADRLLTCYTEKFGKIKVLARGARKSSGKLKNHLEPLTHSEISFVFGKNFKILTGARSLESFPSVKSDLDKLDRAFYFAGLLDELAAGEEKDGKIWGHFLLSLKSLEQNGESALGETFSENFVSGLLCCLGYLPERESFKNRQEDLNKYLCRDSRSKFSYAVFKGFENMLK